MLIGFGKILPLQNVASGCISRVSSGVGYKFRRQHIIDHFIVDFYASEARLVIEIDGEVHKYTEAYDAQRQAYLENIGLTVIRFTNGDILHRLEGVLYQIDDFLTEHIEED